MTIHNSDPFATPAEQRSAVRRLRGRLPAPVTLWTAGTGSGRRGLTVSSMLVGDGDPGRIAGLLDGESDVWAAIERTGRFAVTALHVGEHLIADRFAGLIPSPGGLFATGAWRDTAFGPVPDTAATWAGARLDGAREFGWALLVEATIEEVTLAEDPADGLVHVRGRYR